MEFRVLGQLAVLDDDREPVRITGDLQRRLIATLVNRAGTAISAGVLAETLWGDDQPANPPGALHSQIARLRRTLGREDIVVTDGPGYRLAVADDDVDAVHFEALLDRAAAPDIEPELATSLLSGAVGLWRGDAYEEFTDIDPLRIEAARLDELRLVAIERYGQALFAGGRADAAIAELEHLIRYHPFREHAVATLMRCLDAAGRQGDALRAYTNYRRRLADELGLEPSATLRELDRFIALGDSQTPATASAAHPTGTRATLEAMRVSYIASARHPHLRLAIGTVGDGPPIVAVPAWVTSLDITMSSRDPRSALLERLASTFTVVTYDQPGTGLSRGTVTDFSLAAAVADLRAVIENTGNEPVTLLAVSAAGPTAIALAARHPELVDRLVLFGTFADPHVTFPDPDFSAALVAMVKARWGTGSGMLAQLYRPGASDDAARRLSAILRESADAEAGAAYLAACYESDVSDLLTHVRQPALVIHYRGDKVIPFRGGEHLASHLPNAELLPIDGRYHLPDVADTDRLTRAITDFASPS